MNAFGKAEKTTICEISRGFMRLKNIIAGVLICNLIILIGLQSLIGHFVVYPGFTKIEQQAARDNADRCCDAINREIYHLNITTKDWAIWDDSYRFIDDLNDAYLNSNLSDESFDTNNLHLMYFLNPDGQIVWHHIHDPENNFTPDTLSTVHQAILAKCDRFLSTDSVSGMITTGTTPLLVASCGIYDSKESQPCRGRLIMGRFLNRETIDELINQTHLKFELLPLAHQPVNPAAPPGTSNSQYVFESTRDAMTVSKPVENIDGRTACWIRCEMDRGIAHAGKNVMTLANVVSVIAMTLLAGLLALALNAGVSRPIASLTGQIRAQRTNRHFHQPIEVTGSHETRLLAKEFNQLMTRLKKNLQKRLRTEEELKKTVEQVKLANRSKSDFLANMSHEIRTPMNSIIGFTELLQEEKLDETQKDYLQTISTNANALLHLINDILDMSKIDSGNMTIEAVECSLSEQVEFLKRFIQPLALDKALDFHVSIAPTVPKTIVTDPLRLRQCLINLLGNAVKFTASGSVGLNVYTRDDGHSSRICFAVEDTGIGIAPDRQQAVFDPFIQADSSTTRKYGGTGLGLSITHKLAALMDASIDLQSRPGQGSVFTLILPLSATPQSLSALPHCEC